MAAWHTDFVIGDWCVSTKLNRISKDGQTVSIKHKSMAVLVLLADAEGEVLTRDEIMDGVWPGLEVTDDVLTQAVHELRNAFDDDARHPRIIETIPRVGVRLIAPTTVAEEELPASNIVDSVAQPARRYLLGAFAAIVIGAILWTIIDRQTAELRAMQEAVKREAVERERTGASIEQLQGELKRYRDEAERSADVGEGGVVSGAEAGELHERIEQQATVLRTVVDALRQERMERTLGESDLREAQLDLDRRARDRALEPGAYWAAQFAQRQEAEASLRQEQGELRERLESQAEQLQAATDVLGRERSEPSPVRTEVNSWDARSPHSNRIDVPLLPASKMSRGSSRSEPAPLIVTDPGWEPSSILTPSALMQAMVERTSAPPERPLIKAEPLAIEFKIKAR